MTRHAVRLLNSLARPAVIGMIHVPALPGTPLSSMKMAEILETVQKEAEIYSNAGVDGIIVENMHDIPYVQGRRIGPHIVSAMTRACSSVASVVEAKRSKMALGVQILAGANEAAMAVAHCTGFDFIRAECFVYSHVADEGWMDGCAGDLLRYRRSIGADSVAVFTDIKKKHSSHSVTADVSLAETAKAADFFLADGVIVTGTATGTKADPKDLHAVIDACPSLPVLIGSGVDMWNMKEFKDAKGLIVGTSLKKNGDWKGELCPDRVKRLVQAARKQIR